MRHDPRPFREDQRRIDSLVPSSVSPQSDIWLYDIGTHVACTLSRSHYQTPTTPWHPVPYMGSIVSRALCLSAHRRDRHSLPPKPPDICQHCWEGPFAAHLGFCDAPMEEVYDDMGGRLIGGYRYWTSEAQMVPDDCMWCRLLTRLLRSLSFQEDLSRSYRFGTHRYDHSEFSVAVGRGIAAGLPQSTQMLVISIAGILEFQGHVHTASGESAYVMIRVQCSGG